MTKKIVTFFSATGTTKALAADIAKAVNADLFEIEPAERYTKDDLDWRDSESRSSVEMKNKDMRPAVKDADAKLGEYDVIYVGFPIWWYVAPTVVNTFLEKYDLEGKTIVVFATSGSSAMGNTIEELKLSAKGAEFVDGGVINSKMTKEEISAWIAGF